MDSPLDAAAGLRVCGHISELAAQLAATTSGWFGLRRDLPDARTTSHIRLGGMYRINVVFSIKRRETVRIDITRRPKVKALYS